MEQTLSANGQPQGPLKKAGPTLLEPGRRTSLEGSARNRRLGEILIGAKLLTPEGLDLALKAQKERRGRLGEILVEMGMVSPSDVAMALGLQHNLPAIALKDQQVEAEALSLISEEAARRHLALPLVLLADWLVVAMSDPDDLTALEELEAQAIAEGMVSLARDGMLKAKEGITTPCEVMRNAFSSW